MDIKADGLSEAECRGHH